MTKLEALSHTCHRRPSLQHNVTFPPPVPVAMAIWWGNSWLRWSMRVEKSKALLLAEDVQVGCWDVLPTECEQLWFGRSVYYANALPEHSLVWVRRCSPKLDVQVSVDVLSPKQDHWSHWSTCYRCGRSKLWFVHRQAIGFGKFLSAYLLKRFCLSFFGSELHDDDNLSLT